MTDILRLVPTKLPAVIDVLDAAGEFKQWLQHGSNRAICYFVTKHDDNRFASVSAYVTWARDRLMELQSHIDGTKPSLAMAKAVEKIHSINKRLDLIAAVRRAHALGQVTLTQMRRVKVRVGDPDIYQYIVTKTKR